MEVYTMSVELSDAYALIGFAGTLAFAAAAVLAGVYKAAKWIIDKIEKMFDAHQETLVKKVDGLSEEVGELRKDVGELALGVRSVEVVQNQHGERLAWLEGQSGQPLGSLKREQ